MTATINVNIAARHGACSTGHHDSPECAPIEIPRPIPCHVPPSFTAVVRLGECLCPLDWDARGERTHSDTCPARPIRVTCSISGSTWEESDVADVGTRDETWQPSAPRYYRALSAAQDRWALVKALVLNQLMSPENQRHFPDRAASLIAFRTQRDAVYKALAEMARAEEIVQKAWDDFPLVLRVDAHFGPPETRSSEHILAAYVANLIEQVGNL